MWKKTFDVLPAATALALAAGLGCLQSVVWNGSAAPAAARAMASRLDPSLLQGAAASALTIPPESYFGYGRLAIGVYGLLALASLRARRWLPRWTVAGFVPLLALATTGDLLAYWVSETAGPSVRRVGFWYIELPALVTIALGLSAVGAVRWRQRRPGAALALALPASLMGTAALRYLPHGIFIGIAGTFVLTELLTREARVEGSSRASMRAAGATLLALVGLGALAVPYRPNLVSSGRTPSAAMQVPPVPGLRLHVFNTGENRMSELLVGRNNPWRPVPAFVIEHPHEGLIVFDTGLSDAVAARGTEALPWPERWLMESHGARAGTLPAQMRGAGLDPEQVRFVIVSHLHEDHIGQLSAFPKATFIAGAGTEELARARGFATRWRTVSFDHSVGLGPFDGDERLFGDGSVTLLRGGGHAREDLMALLGCEEGPILLTGDAVVHADWLASSDVQRIAVDNRRAAEVREQVRAFERRLPEAIALFGHDIDSRACAREGVTCHGVDFEQRRGNELVAGSRQPDSSRWMSPAYGFTLLLSLGAFLCAAALLESGRRRQGAAIERRERLVGAVREHETKECGA
jgi:N-acyl homoserine lactone hydrolase